MEITKELLHKKYWEEGKSLSIIAKELECGYGTLQRIFASLEIPRRKFSTKGLHPNVGRKASEECRRHISEAMTGRKLSANHREKVIKSLVPWPKGVGGESHPAWKGGMIYLAGYVYLKCPGHPHELANGYVKRATLVAEKKLGRYLEYGEVTHHINEVKDDDRPENIQVVSPSEHTMIHNELRRRRKKEE